MDTPTLQSLPPFTFTIQGTIIRKKNVSADYLKIAIQPKDAEKSTTVHISRKDMSSICTPSDISFLHLNTVIYVRGHTTPASDTADGNDIIYNHVTECKLIKCPPSTKLIKEVLALPNYTSFASTFSMDETALQQLVENENNTQKIIIHTILERITGEAAKAPPKYRAGRVKRCDLDILNAKEIEGRLLDTTTSAATTNSNDLQSWQLCQPCNSTNDTISYPIYKKEQVINLPTGSDNIQSAHGKLTRGEYLETKKNNQVTWFIERIRQFDSMRTNNNLQEEQNKPITFLDVGGGRGDLAVQIALNFTNAHVIVVDCNESSILAGQEYASKSDVSDRIEFVCLNFSEYIHQYNNNDDEAEDGSSGCESEKHYIDFVVALHACGDLSDMALHFAKMHNTNFIICPCCYPKRYLAPFEPYWHGLCKNATEVDSLSRLVELDDHREVSRRAMLVINSMRRRAFVEKRQDVKLEEFDTKISKRNIALVGTTKAVDAVVA